MRIEILPSLLAADFGCLADEIRRAEASGAEALHLDIMDANFVPNLSFGPDVVALAKKVAPNFYRNVHLMMARPDLYLEKFANAGAQTIQIHVEADCDLHRELRRIRELGLKNAIVINPETPVTALEPYLGEIDEALVMTVHPGYGGQKFIADCMPKVAYLRERRPDLDIMVDGGINSETAVIAAMAGANQFVAGSYLFRQADMKSAVDEMRGGYALGRLSEVARYAKYGANFAKAVEFLQRPDLAQLPIGRYELDGAKVFAMVQECDLREFGTTKPELHRRYFDIQLPISGEETIGLTRFDPRDAKDFDVEKDCSFYDVASKPVELHPGEFVIIAPGICAHAPCCTQRANKKVRKVVVKVQLDMV